MATPASPPSSSPSSPPSTLPSSPSPLRLLPTGPLRSVALAFAAYLLAVLVSCYLSRQPSSLVTVWYPNAVGALLLLARPPQQWPVLLGLLMATNAAVNLLFGDSLTRALLFLPANAAAMLAAAWLLRRTQAHADLAGNVGALVRTLFLGGVVPTLLGAVAGTLIIGIYERAALDALWIGWFEGDLVAAIAVLPIGLLVLQHGWRWCWQQIAALEHAALLLIAVGVALYVPVHVPFPFVYLTVPLVWLAVRSNFATTALGVLLVSLAMSTLVASGVFVPPPMQRNWDHVLLYLPLLLALAPPLLLAAAVAETALRQERRLAASEARFAALYRRSPTMMCLMANDGRVLGVSEQWLDRMGYAEQDVVGRSITEFLVEADRRAAADDWLPFFRKHGYCNDVACCFLTRSGEGIDTLLSAIAQPDDSGRFNSAMTVLQDVTEKKRLAARLAAEQELVEVTLHSIGDGVISTDAQGRIIYMNPVAESMLRWTRTEAQGLPFGDVVKLHDFATLEPLPDPVRMCIEQHRKFGLPENAILIDRRGTQYAIQDSVAPIRARNGEVLGAVMVFQDVTESRAMARRMSYLAQHDALTDLPNRVLLLDRVQQACERSLRNRMRFAIVFIDVDHFKHVNDSLGHAVGDELLRAVAQRLKSAVRASDTVCRLGGDEFVILLDDLHGTDGAEVCQKLLFELTRPYLLADAEVNVTASLGVAVFPHDGAEPETLMKHADIAMYRAKREGRNRYQFFSRTIDKPAIERLRLESDIRRGIEENEFLVHYQPLVDFNEQRVVGFEALARWLRPGSGLMGPGSFVPVAEETRLILPLGQVILHQACLQMRRWIARGMPLQRMAVNISAVQFMSTGFARTVLDTLERVQLDPRYLELEIVESTLMNDPKVARTVIDQLREAGVRIALDDFGTGYSSLSYLHRFRVDTLKIDQSFVHDLIDDASDRKVVEAIISLATSLNLHLVAEGVETLQQARLLRGLGCGWMQGHWFSPAIDAALVEEDFLQRLTLTPLIDEPLAERKGLRSN